MASTHCSKSRRYRFTGIKRNHLTIQSQVLGFEFKTSQSRVFSHNNSVTRSWSKKKPNFFPKVAQNQSMQFYRAKMVFGQRLRIFLSVHQILLYLCHSGKAINQSTFFQGNFDKSIKSCDIGHLQLPFVPTRVRSLLNNLTIFSAMTQWIRPRLSSCQPEFESL